MSVTIGFISVRQHLEHGYFGGYLVVSRQARPLEFHCTMPVKPARAQVVLYGPTLDDFVCGEQIAKALISKAKLTPSLILTDGPAVLAASSVCDVPLACLLGQPSEPNSSAMLLPTNCSLQTESVHIGRYRLEVVQGSGSFKHLQSTIEQLNERFDLFEPFGRIAEALGEAHPILKAA
jgi:hypothetical protein